MREDLLREPRPGADERRLLREASEGEPAAFALALIDALALAHLKGMAHGSLELDHVYVEPDGRLRISGLHLQHGPAAVPPHLAPWFTQQVADPTALDAVAVALIAHELLTGQAPDLPPPTAGLDAGARASDTLRTAIRCLSCTDPAVRVSLREAAVGLRTDVASTVDTPLQAEDDGTELGRAGRYELRELLGTGAHGVVLRAWDPDLQREVALKRLKEAPDADTREQLLHEARAVARLSHPSIVSIHDVGRDHLGDWFTMDLIDGPTLEQRTASGPVDWMTAASWVAELAQGLQHAHDAGIVHRDIKPANVLMDGERPRLTDFGLAFEEAAPQGMAGTPLYMAPEQIASDSAAIGPHTDVYALGVVLFELLAGHNPFLRSTVAEVLEAVHHGSSPDLSTLRPDLPSDLCSLVMRAMARDAEVRPRAGDLADILREMVLRSSSLELSTSELVARDPRRRPGRRLHLALGGLVAVALLAATPWAWSSWQESARSSRAEARTDEVLSRIEQLGAHTAEASAAFEALTVDPELDGTDALARAWLARAAQLDDPVQVLDAAARAYALSRAPRTRDEALLRLAVELRRQQRWAGLVAAIDQLNSLGVAVPARLRRDALAADGDLGDAADLIEDPDLAAFVRSLSAYTHTGGVQLEFTCIWRGSDGLHDLMRLTGPRGQQHMELLDPQTGTWTEIGPWPSRARCGAAVHDLYGESVRVVSRLDGPGDSRMNLFVWRDGDGIDVRPLPEHALERGQQRRGDRSVAGDIDGDGHTEIWLAVKPDRVVGFEIPPQGEGGPQALEIAPELATLDSWALPKAVLDLDGDGDDELVVHVREFGAYDLRAYDLVEGESRLERRLQTGDLRSVAVGEGSELAVQVLQTPAQPHLFPGPEHLAAQPGVHLLSPAGQSWQPVALIDDTSHPAHARGWRSDAVLIPYDLDLDGRLDFIASSEAGTRIIVQRPHGYEVVAHLPYLLVSHAAELDGDPQPELLVVGQAEGDHIDGVLGLGRETWAPASLEAPTFSPAPPGLSRADHQLWSQVEVLITLGLHEVASHELESLAARSAGTPIAELALARAGSVQAEHGDLMEARRLLEAARGAATPAPAPETLRGLGQVLSGLVDLQAAARLAEIALARPDLSDEDRAWWGELASRSESSSSAGEVRGPGSLDGWQVRDPLALRVADDGAWHVIGTAHTPVLSREVHWDGSPISIDWDVQIERMEPPVHALVLLEPIELEQQANVQVLQRVYVGAEGSPAASQVVAGCQQPAWMEQFGRWPEAGGGRLQLWLGLDLDQPVRHCAPQWSVSGDAVPSERRFGGDLASLIGDVQPGRYRLSVELMHRWGRFGRGELAELTVRDLVVRGVRPVPGPQDALARASAALATGRPEQALSVLDHAPRDLPHDAARLVAAEEIGDTARARAALSRLWASFDEDKRTRTRIGALLRARPRRMARLMAPTLGTQWPRLAWRTWRVVARSPDTLPQAEVEDLALALDTLDALSPDQLDADGRRALIRLLVLRACLRRRLGRLPTARADRQRARLLIGDDADLQRSLAVPLGREQVLGAAAEGDLEAAIEAAERLAETAPDPPTAIDALDAHPDLAELRSHPRWPGIRAARMLPPGGWPW